MQQQQQWFTKTEDTDRKLTDAFLHTHIISKTPNEYVARLYHTPEGWGFDCFITYHYRMTGNLYRVDRFEVKKRDAKYDSLMLQRDKFNNLIASQNGADRSFYLNFLPDGETYCYNLTRMMADDYVFDWQRQSLPVNSAGGAALKRKTACNIPLTEASRFAFDWRLVELTEPIQGTQLEDHILQAAKVLTAEKTS